MIILKSSQFELSEIKSVNGKLNKCVLYTTYINIVFVYEISTVKIGPLDIVRTKCMNFVYQIMALLSPILAKCKTRCSLDSL